jgi:hypothetical protein
MNDEERSEVRTLAIVVLVLCLVTICDLSDRFNREAAAPHAQVRAAQLPPDAQPSIGPP